MNLFQVLMIDQDIACGLRWNCVKVSSLLCSMPMDIKRDDRQVLRIQFLFIEVSLVDRGNSF